MQREHRTQYLQRIKPTLQEPDVVILQNDGAYIFAKSFGDKKFFASVVRDENGEWIVRSNAPKSVNNLHNKIKEGGKVVYGKLPDVQINAHIANGTKADSNSAGRQSNSTPPNIKEGLEKGRRTKACNSSYNKSTASLPQTEKR